MKKAIFLDRDGVLNETIFRMGKPRAPYTLEEFSLIEGVTEAISAFRDQGYLLIVVTNQPDVARGWVSREAVDQMNQRVFELLRPDEIKACFHTEKDHCTCRKPRPGMLLEAAQKWDIDLGASFMVGDRDSDVEAGKAAGTKTILVGSGDESKGSRPDFVCRNLLEASRIILSLS